MKSGFAEHEGVKIPIDVQDWKECHGITLCCITLNEDMELKEFLEYHRPYVDKVVVVDGGSNDRTVEIAKQISNKVLFRQFDGHYSNQANRAFESAYTDWILLMDCDERMERGTLENLRKMIDQEEFDCYSFPRKNFIDGKRDPENEPDYQERLFRSYCRRIRPVHGEMVGYKNRKFMPQEDGNYIIHKKRLERHLLRNRNYKTFETKFIREMGAPGVQNREGFYRMFPYLSPHLYIVQ